jgi:large repetitive protein
MSTPQIRRVSSRRHCMFAFLVACLPALFAAGTAANDLCGATILADLTLDHDLTCAGTGLIAGADGITIDLNGHTIAGLGTGAGIDVTGRAYVSISGGTISNFAAGVLIVNSTGTVVKGNELRENTDGVDCRAGCVGSTIRENDFRENLARGIMLRGASVGNLVKENTFIGDRVGILLFGASGSVVTENNVSATTLAGIRINVIATGNLVIENTTVSNPIGIDFVTNTGTGPTGNTVAENTIASNVCGLHGPSAGNTFTENLFEGNATDICA